MHSKLMSSMQQQFNSFSCGTHTHTIEINGFTYCARLDPSNAQSWKNRASHTSQRMRHWNWINQCVAAIRCRKTNSWSFANIFSFFCVYHSTFYLCWRFLSFRRCWWPKKTGRTVRPARNEKKRKSDDESQHIFFGVSSPKFNAINKMFTCNGSYMEFIV